VRGQSLHEEERKAFNGELSLQVMVDSMQPLADHSLESPQMLPPTPRSQPPAATPDARTSGCTLDEVSLAAPTLHTSEFFQVLIQKQHEVERFFTVRPEDIPDAAITKMAMMKNELDLLSGTICSVLGKTSDTAQPVAQGSWPIIATAGSFHEDLHGTVRHYDQAIPQNWPIVDAVPAPYMTEADVLAAAAAASAAAGNCMPPGYHMNGIPPVMAEALQQAAPAAYPVEENHGPAMFQGFAPPPSFAWDRSSFDEARGRAGGKEEASADAADAQANHGGSAPDHVQPQRPRAINTSSPVPLGLCESSMKHALLAAMDELHRCQKACADLREEKRGPPVAEVEQLCLSIGERLDEVSERFQERLEVYRKKSRRKDETIKRLHRKLQALHGETSELFGLPSQSWSPARQARQSQSVEKMGHERDVADESQLEMGVDTVDFAAWETELPRCSDQPSVPDPATSRREANLRRREVDLAGQVRIRDAQVEQLTATLHQLQTVTQRQIGLYKRQLHIKDNSLQALEEQLMQQAPYRDMGPAIEGSVPDGVSTGGSAGAPPSSTPGSSRGGQLRRQQGGSQASVPAYAASGLAGNNAASPCGGGAIPSGATIRREGTTPRPSGDRDRERIDRDGRGERGRGTAVQATWALQKKETRERSLGAAVPTSPRTKHRVITGHSHAATAAEASLRRRTSLGVGGALGRSNSADDPGSLKAARNRSSQQQQYDAEAAAAAAIAAKARLRESGVGAQVQRTRR
jgi:hypothetical protein